MCLPPCPPRVHGLVQGQFKHLFVQEYQGIHIERRGRDLKDDLAWQPVMSVEAQQDSVSQLLQAYDALTLQALTGSTYVVDAINALGS